MKKVYLVRHGQTENNAIRRIGSTEDPLNKKGELQAQLIAQRLQDVEFDIIFSSPYLRTRQTTAAILELVKKEVIYSELFKESKSASEIEGKSTDSEEVMEIQKKIRALWGVKGTHFSDEEDFYDLSARVYSALEFLSARPEERILVVTHGAFIRMVAWTILLGDLLQPGMTQHMFRSVVLSNTGVTVIEQDDEGKWLLVRLNDTIHLDPETESL